MVTVQEITDYYETYYPQFLTLWESFDEDTTSALVKRAVRYLDGLSYIGKRVADGENAFPRTFSNVIAYVKAFQKEDEEVLTFYEDNENVIPEAVVYAAAELIMYFIYTDDFAVESSLLQSFKGFFETLSGKVEAPKEGRIPYIVYKLLKPFLPRVLHENRYTIH